MAGTSSDGADDLSAVVKAYTVGENAVVSSANARDYEDELALAYEASGALIPRYEPYHCVLLYEKSSALRPCVESYATNVDAFGFHLEPVLDLEKSNANDLVRAALRQQRIFHADPTPVTDEDVAATSEIIRREAEIEEFRLTNFFAYCCPESSFVDLRQETRIDLESTGNAYWEVVRDGVGRIQSFQRIDVVTMRIMPRDPRDVVVSTPQKVSPIAYADVPVPRRFRGFVQIIRGVAVCFFKQFGDPRTMSARTGRYYDDKKAMVEVEGDSVHEATEVIHHKVYAPLGPYGVPRWVGATMNIAGLRASEEVNYMYFDNKGVPPLAILVSGGTLRQGAVEKIEQHVREAIKGRANYHSVLILEAASSGSTADARCRIELKNLMDAQHTDALFQAYEAASDRKIGRQFRLPDLLRGASQEVNRAQADAVLKMAEQQVFQPIRESFDHLMTRWIFADMGIRYWTFVSNSATAADAAELTTIGAQWVQAGVLTPNEGRALAGDALNKDYKTLDDAWAQQPIPLTLAGIIPGDLGADGSWPDDAAVGDAATTPAPKLAPLAAQVLALQQALRAGSAAGHTVQMERARVAANTMVVQVPDELFKTFVEEDAR